MKAKHTKGPYFVAGDIGTIAATVEHQKVAIGTALATGPLLELAHKFMILPANANAAFIVKACNSHDDLLELCKLVLRYGERAELVSVIDDGMGRAIAIEDELVELAQAAITKAKGE